MLEQRAEANVIEAEGDKENSLLYSGYMKKASLKAQMAKQIESLQNQLDYLKKEYDKECIKLETTRTSEEKSRGELDRLGKDYDNLSANIRQSKKKEIDEIHRLQSHLNKTIAEYNTLLAQNTEKSRVLDGVRNDLEERENRLDKEHSSRLLQHKATEKDLNSQMEAAIAERSKVQEKIKEMLKEKDAAEKEQTRAKSMVTRVLLGSSGKSKRNAENLTSTAMVRFLS